MLIPPSERLKSTFILAWVPVDCPFSFITTFSPGSDDSIILKTKELGDRLLVVIVGLIVGDSKVIISEIDDVLNP